MTTRPRFCIHPETNTLALVTSPKEDPVQFFTLGNSDGASALHTLKAEELSSKAAYTSLCLFQENGGNLYCTLTNLDKDLFIYNVTEKSLTNHLRTKKRITDVLEKTSSQGQKLYFADKFGDVWSLEVQRMREKQPEVVKPVNRNRKHKLTEEEKKALQEKEEEQRSLKPLLTLELGHLASLTHMTLSRDSKFMITTDREEKIRVSHFPNVYDIWSFCLGHKQSVSAIGEVVLADAADSAPNPKAALVSGSIDKTLKVWQYSDESKPLRCSINVPEYPFLIRTNKNYVAVGFESSSKIQIYKVSEEFELQALEKSTLEFDSEVLHFEFVENNKYLLVLLSKAPNFKLFKCTPTADLIEFQEEDFSNNKFSALSGVSFDFVPDSTCFPSSMKKTEELNGRHKKTSLARSREEKAKRKQEDKAENSEDKMQE